MSDLKIKDINRMIATRQNSAEFYTALMGFLPDPDPILRKNGKDIKVYNELILDPHVFSCIEQRKAITLSMEWELDRGKSKSRNAKFIQGILEDEDFDLFQVMESMLDAIAFGFIPFEILWKNIGSYIIPVKVLSKPVEWFLFDDNNQLKFKNKENPLTGMELPARQFLCAQHKSTYNNPYGERVLSRCFWPVTFKRAPEKWWIRFLEKFGSIYPVGKLPRNLMGEGSREQDKLLELLDNLVEDGIAVIPDDSSVELLESTGKAATTGIYKEKCEYSNQEISKAILTQTLTTEIGDKGSYAASSTHADMLTHLALKDKKIIEREINKLIAWVYELNFTNDVPPRFSMYLPEDIDKNLADRDKLLKEIGVSFNKNYFVNNYNLSEDEFEIAAPPADKTETQPAKKKDVDIPDEGNASNVSDEFQESRLKTWAKKFIHFFSEDKPVSAKPNVDILAASVPDAILQQYMDTMLKPVFDLISSGSSLEEVNNKLAELYPEMNTKDLENLLAKMFFISEVYGRLSVE